MAAVVLAVLVLDTDGDPQPRSTCSSKPTSKQKLIGSSSGSLTGPGSKPKTAWCTTMEAEAAAATFRFSHRHHCRHRPEEVGGNISVQAPRVTL